MMTATPNDVRFANYVCLAAHFMANIASLRNEVEQHHICEANASYRRRRCFIVIRGQIRTATLEMFTKLWYNIAVPLMSVCENELNAGVAQWQSS